MTTCEFIETAQKAIADFLTAYHLKPVESDDVFVVWQCKTLQNHKAILAAPTPDNLLFEATYNGDKQEMYIDAYDKIKNFRIGGADNG